MLDLLSKRINKLLSELAIYQEQMNDAIRLEDEQLYKNASALGRETLEQLWEARRIQEEQKPIGLYFREPEHT